MKKCSIAVKVKDAAAIMGVAALTIRAWLIYGKWRLPSGVPVGEAMKLKKNGRYNYFISAPKMAEYLGISEAELWKKIKEAY